jgi:crotonobetainyl-CoA:carnitine CoA-transferase CaiB-like acyl-CoA transferase
MGRVFRNQAGNPLWNHYRCQDDQWLCLGMLQADRYWADFCRAIGRPGLIDDERFANMRVRTQNAAACISELDAAFAGRPRDEWIEVFAKSEGDFILTLVNSVADLPADPQVIANDYVVDFEHPNHGSIQMQGMPVQLCETPGQLRTPAPEFGQHSEEILLDLLGYDWDRITALRESDVI